MFGDMTQHFSNFKMNQIPVKCEAIKLLDEHKYYIKKENINTFDYPQTKINYVGIPLIP